MITRPAALALVMVTACTFAGTGGSGGSAQLGSTGGSDDTASAGPSNAATDTASDAANSTTDAPDVDTGVNTTTSAAGDGTSAAATSAGDDAGTTAAVDPCDSPPTVMLQQTADQGVVVPPMQIFGTVAYSEIAESGTISFTFAADCADEYAIWVQVYDGEPGPFDLLPGEFADSYYVEVDGSGSEVNWDYGCDTVATPWSWQAISTHGPDCSDDSMAVFDFAAGQHTLEFRNAEAGDATELPPTAAMLSSVIITNDLDYHP